MVSNQSYRDVVYDDVAFYWTLASAVLVGAPLISYIYINTKGHVSVGSAKGLQKEIDELSEEKRTTSNKLESCEERLLETQKELEKYKTMRTGLDKPSDPQEDNDTEPEVNSDTF